MTTAAIAWETAFTGPFDGVVCVLIEGVPLLLVCSGDHPTSVAVTSGSLDALFHFPVGSLTVTRPDSSTFDPVVEWLDFDAVWTTRETTRPVDGTVETEPVRFELFDPDGAATALLSAPRSRFARLLASDAAATGDLVLDSAVGVPSTGFAHVGREMVGWGAVAGSTLNVGYAHGGRGLFGSHARPHVVGDGTRRATVTLGDFPKYLTGRRITVFLGRMEGDVLYDPTPVHIGVCLAGVQLAANLMRWQIPADSLLNVLDQRLTKVSVRAFGWQHGPSTLAVNFVNELSLGPTDGNPLGLGWSASPEEFARYANAKGQALSQQIQVGFTGGRFRITATGPGTDVSWQIAACWLTAYRTGTSVNLGENTEVVPECVMHLDGAFAVRREGDWDLLPSTLSWTATLDGHTGRAVAALVGDTDNTKGLFAQIVARDATNRLLSLQAYVDGLSEGYDATQPGAIEVASRITKATELTLGLIVTGDSALSALRAMLTAVDALQGTNAADTLVDWSQIARTFARVGLGGIPEGRALRVSGSDDSLITPLVHECRLRGAALCIRRGRLGAYRPGYFATTEGIRRAIVEEDLLAGVGIEVLDGIEPVVTAIRYALPDGSYTWRDNTSAEDFGEGKLVECKALEHVVVPADVSIGPILQRTAQQLLGVLSQPTRIVRIVVGPSFWDLDAGDLVTLTHSAIPNLHGSRGLDACLAQVMESRKSFGGGQCRVQLALLISDDTAIAGYAPSALVSAIVGAVVTIDTTSSWGTNGFAPDVDADGNALTSQPLQGFAVGDRVQLSELNNESPMADEFFVIVSLTATTVTLDGSPSAPMATAAASPYGCLLRFAPWTDSAVTTRQRQYLYIADHTAEDLGSGDTPKRWAA